MDPLKICLLTPDNFLYKLIKKKINNDQFLMKVKAIGINRAETLHRMGKYPIKK